MSQSEPENFTRHTGKPVLVKFVGGAWHGDIKRLRRPLRSPNRVARPPRYLGDNMYESAVIEYDTYILKQDGPDLYYVEESMVDGFPENKNTGYETANARRLRLEREAGGPRDLVEEGVVGHSEELRKSIDRKVGRSGEEEKAQKDFEMYGIGIMVDGKRIDPRTVRLLINVKNPLTLTLKDLISRRT